MSFSNILLVGIGGFLGSIARYACSVFIGQKSLTDFPYATFIVNVVGAFILGLVYQWSAQQQTDSQVRIFLVTGFCGGFTTFSAFAFENYGLISNRSTATSLVYISLTIVTGIVAVWLGMTVMKKIR